MKLPPDIPHNLAREDLPPSPDVIARSLLERPFKPHPLFSSGDAQTVIGHAWPRRFDLHTLRADEERLFEVERDVRLLAHCSWQRKPTLRPTLLLVHGLEGSSHSKYMLGTAEKAFRAGFNIIRLNLRGCGGTEHLTPTLYHGGQSGDLRVIVKELIEGDHLPAIFLVGFSMGGNIVLKLAGEDAGRIPREVSGICAVSPSLDLSACAAAIKRRAKWVYQPFFIRSLRRRLHLKHKLYPERYDTRDLQLVRTIRDFDDRYTALDGGFRDAEDYYRRASALPLIDQVSRPTLIIQAQDDPFIPFEPFDHPSIASNPYILLVAPGRGGHVGFIAGDTTGEDRFWAENRLVEFCQLLHEGGA